MEEEDDTKPKVTHIMKTLEGCGFRNWTAVEMKKM